MAISPSGLVAGPINARAREIERVCKQAYINPEVTKILVGMAERQNVQHQQVMALATEFGRLVDMQQQIMNKLGILGSRLEKAGVVDKLKSLEAQDDGPDNTMS